jgi:2-C-methyl-D-erythritol 4-phosphate cytidylyltransferase
VIIVAGGSGTRMNNKTPKQFLLIAEKPLLFHSINTFYNFSKDLSIILVLPTLQIEKWKSLCNEYNYNVPHIIVEGGKTRYNSVKNGLKLIDEPALIAIHDGVRPLVSHKTISNSYNGAEKNGTAIPVVNINDSLRELYDNKSKSVNRNNYKIVQTPQCFKSEILHKAYQQNYDESFTDDASVVEKTGIRIFLVEGNMENIKITTPYDLLIAEFLMMKTPK